MCAYQLLSSARQWRSRLRRISPLAAGKIQTGRFKCLTGLYTPSDWDSRAVLERARRRPDAHLELDFVYGYAGNTKFLIEKGQRIDPQSSFVSPNLFYTSTREVAYFMAATGSALEWETTCPGHCP